MKWLKDVFTKEQLGPEDIILHELAKRLRADALLSGLFGAECIYAQDVLGAPPLTKLPELVVSSIVGKSDLVPSSQLLHSRFFIVVRFLAAIREPLEEDEGSIPTLFRYIQTLLLSSGNKLLNITSPRGVEFGLARLCTPGAVNYKALPLDHSNPTGPVLFEVILEWNYELQLDVTTGRIFNLVVNGM